MHAHHTSPPCALLILAIGCVEPPEPPALVPATTRIDQDSPPDSGDMDAPQDLATMTSRDMEREREMGDLCPMFIAGRPGLGVGSATPVSTAPVKVYYTAIKPDELHGYASPHFQVFTAGVPSGEVRAVVDSLAPYYQWSQEYILVTGEYTLAFLHWEAREGSMDIEYVYDSCILRVVDPE